MNNKQIQKWKLEYQKDTKNKEIEKEITIKGINEVCICKEKLENINTSFNIELPENIVYYQANSLRCWCFAGINFIKQNVMENMKVKKEFAISINYLTFFHKLESANRIYEGFIKSKKYDMKYLVEQVKLFDFCVTEEGNWEEFFKLIEKYGIVPESQMPETFNSAESELLNILYREKVKKDLMDLVQLKKQNKSKQELNIVKEKMLQSNFEFLCKILGEPPTKFDFNYENDKNEQIELKNITPNQFKKRYVTIQLQDYVVISNLHMYHKKFYQKYQQRTKRAKLSYQGYLNLPMEEVKELTIKQLQDGIPVYFGSEITKMRDNKAGVLDNKLYQYEKILGVKPMTKEEAMNSYETIYRHVMTFKGVNIENGVPNRWKAEDSYSNNVHQNGYYIMQDDFFEQFVLFVVIHKKYLNEKQLEAWNQKPIIAKLNDPI